MAKVGFNGQWIEIARVGKATDSRGVDHEFTPDWIQQVIANYAAGSHDAPVVLGHPENDSAPAYGWASDLRLNGDVLEAKFADTSDEFEAAVRRGEYKKRSASFYLDPPNLRHVGFLGAQPPAIKGLRDIQFAEGESFAVESSINFKETEMEEKDLDQLPESFWEKFKSKLGIGATTDLSEKKGQPEEKSTAQFSEADLKALVTEAVKEVKAEFSEQIQTLTTANEDLQKKVAGQISGSRRGEIVSFVEKIPAEKGRHFLKRAGIVEFMESLAVADAADGDKEAICFSEGTGDEKVDHKFSRLGWFQQLVDELPPIAQFGEKFGNLVATPEADSMVRPDVNKSIDKVMGSDEGGDE